MDYKTLILEISIFKSKEITPLDKLFVSFLAPLLAATPVGSGNELWTISGIILDGALLFGLFEYLHLLNITRIVSGILESQITIYDTNLNNIYQKRVKGTYSEKMLPKDLFKIRFFREPILNEELIKNFLKEAEDSFLINLTREIENINKGGQK